MNFINMFIYILKCKVNVMDIDFEVFRNLVWFYDCEYVLNYLLRFLNGDIIVKERVERNVIFLILKMEGSLMKGD